MTLNAAPVTGWLKDTSFGGGATAALTAANTNSPILGNGASNNADNTAIYAAFPLVSLGNGQRVTLSGSAQMIGSSSNGDFRWGLFKNDGVGAVTGGWLGYMASAESTIWAKDPMGGNFANATFASVTEGRAAALGQVTEPNNLSFAAGTYQFEMAVERFDNEVDVQISIINSNTGFSIVSPTFTETNPTRLTFAFDRVGFLSGSILDADQIRFSGIDVATAEIESPTLNVYSSGLVVIANPTNQSVDMTHYEIISNADALNPAGWTSLDSQENNDPIGEGWEEAGASDSGVLAEVNLLSMSTLDSGERLGLGHAFATGGTQDLAFRYTTPEGEIRRGVVNYLLSGDYNGDGSVDAADYVVWRRSFGASVPFGEGADGDGNGQIDESDYQIWRSHNGLVAGSGSNQSTTVPEPAILPLTLLAMAVLLQQPAVRRRRSHV